MDQPESFIVMRKNQAEQSAGARQYHAHPDHHFIGYHADRDKSGGGGPF